MTKRKVGPCAGCGRLRTRVAFGLCWRCYELVPVEVGRLLRSSNEHLQEARARADERGRAAQCRALARCRKAPVFVPRQTPPEEDIYGWALATDGMGGE